MELSWSFLLDYRHCTHHFSYCSLFFLSATDTIRNLLSPSFRNTSISDSVNACPVCCAPVHLNILVLPFTKVRTVLSHLSIPHHYHQLSPCPITTSVNIPWFYVSWVCRIARLGITPALNPRSDPFVPVIYKVWRPVYSWFCRSLSSSSFTIPTFRIQVPSPPAKIVSFISASRKSFFDCTIETRSFC